MNHQVEGGNYLHCSWYIFTTTTYQPTIRSKTMSPVQGQSQVDQVVSSVADYWSSDEEKAPSMFEGGGYSILHLEAAVREAGLYISSPKGSGRFISRLPKSHSVVDRRTGHSPSYPNRCDYDSYED
ncbi:MAG TPA: hypothetical protein VK338_03785 [Candidatus Nitrosocosmicus sp.]|nr:hypothetical protein [Candidatus Nitrosocosmicus sp.]